jgi:error-prone DNA polymerase
MGFYAPAQIVCDARDHGVEVRPVCVNQSLWDCTLEGSAWAEGRALIPLRLGLRMVSGLGEADVDRILAARSAGPFASVEDVWRRSGVPRAALERIANADGFQGLGFSRRQALWQVRGLRDVELPLFATARLRESEREPAVSLRPMTEGREVVEDYRHTQLSLRDHPLAFLRGELETMRILPCAALAGIKDGRKVEVAGIILVRQRPGKGNVTFITIEDETGIANIILWQCNFEAQRRVVMASAMISVKGTLQREGDVIHVIADRLEDRTAMLRRVGDMDFTHRTGRGDGATQGGGPDRGEGGRPRRQDRHALLSARPNPENVIPIKSRDFH